MCGACGKPVKGQFVRAMNKVFHLNCFRCRVSSFTGSHIVPIVAASSHVHPLTGLQYHRSGQVFPSRGHGRIVPAMRARLFCSSGFDLREM
jgi:hypothetical protein